MSHTEMHLKDILPEVESFLNDSGMRPTTFGRRVCGDSQFVNRLRNGGKVYPWTAKRVLNFIKKQLPDLYGPNLHKGARDDEK